MSFNVSHLRYLEPQVLKSWIDNGKSATSNGKFLVVDVRDGDYIGGHITNCVHYPSKKFNSQVDQLSEYVEKGDFNDIVFHCALSQQRGPSMAMKFIRHWDRPKSEDLNVWILRGGFTKWQELYGEDTSVTEDYIKDLWSY